MIAQELAATKPYTRTFGLLEWSNDAAAMLLAQAQEIESLRKERDDYKADAERYRKLKNSNGPVYAYAKDGPDDHGWFPAFGEELQDQGIPNVYVQDSPAFHAWQLGYEEGQMRLKQSKEPKP